MLAEALFLAAATAQPTGWADWLMPTGTICVETGGSTIAAQAAANWNRSDAVIVARPVCTGYARNMTVKFRGYNDPDEKACAVTYSEAGWTRRTVRGVSILTPNAPIIRVNYAANIRSGCRATSQQIEHVYNHEVGHVLGLAHNHDASVMGAWAYRTPTLLDLQRVNRRY